jgi:hypothetical protein
MGIALSSSVKEAGYPKALMIVLLSVVGFLAPAAYFIGWALEGGREEIRANIERMTGKDPLTDASQAVSAQDYRLKVTVFPLDNSVPGCRVDPESWRKAFGTIPVALFGGDHLTPEQKGINAAAKTYMSEYNKVINKVAVSKYPDWKNRSKE